MDRKDSEYGVLKECLELWQSQFNTLMKDPQVMRQMMQYWQPMPGGKGGDESQTASGAVPYAAYPAAYPLHTAFTAGVAEPDLARRFSELERRMAALEQRLESISRTLDGADDGDGAGYAEAPAKRAASSR